MKLFCKHKWKYYTEDGKQVGDRKGYKFSEVIGSSRICQKCKKAEVFVPVVSVVNVKEIEKLNAEK